MATPEKFVWVSRSVLKIRGPKKSSEIREVSDNLIQIWPVRPDRIECANGGIAFKETVYMQDHGLWPTSMRGKWFSGITGISIKGGECIKMRIPKSGFKILKSV